MREEYDEEGRMEEMLQDVRVDKTKGEPVTAEDRDHLIKKSVTNWQVQPGGHRVIDHHVSSALVTKLHEKGLIDDDFTGRPSIEEMLEVGRQHPNTSYNGFMISPFREDCRITFDRIIIYGLIGDELLAAFIKLAEYADESTMEKNHLEAWWD